MCQAHGHGSTGSLFFMKPYPVRTVIWASDSSLVTPPEHSALLFIEVRSHLNSAIFLPGASFLSPVLLMTYPMLLFIWIRGHRPRSKRTFTRQECYKDKKAKHLSQPLLSILDKMVCSGYIDVRVLLLRTALSSHLTTFFKFGLAALCVFESY